MLINFQHVLESNSFSRYLSARLMEGTTFGVWVLWVGYLRLTNAGSVVAANSQLHIDNGLAKSPC